MPTPANSINEATTGITGFTGTAFTGTPVTQYNLLTGSSTSSTLNNVAPSATSGIPLVSGGSSTQPSYTTMSVAGGGTGNTSFTAYSIIAAGTTSTGAFQNVSGVGTSGQFLTSNGASALPTWQTIAASSSFTFISSQTASTSASINFTGLSSSYAAYIVIYANVYFDTGSTSSAFGLRTSSNNGVSYDSTAGDYTSSTVRVTQVASPATGFIGGNSEDKIIFTRGRGTTTSQPSSGLILFPNPTQATYTQVIHISSCIRSDGQSESLFGSGRRLSTSGVNAIQFLATTGNISAGLFKLYGIAA